MILAQASTNGLALGLFAVILAVTLGITAWASKRTSTATDFWTAGRSITGLQNGLAITGDNLSAAAFLGLTGLIFLNGFDGWIVAIASTVALLPVLLFLAERMRNAG